MTSITMPSALIRVVVWGRGRRKEGWIDVGIGWVWSEEILLRWLMKRMCRLWIIIGRRMAKVVEWWIPAGEGMLCL